jgi:hypothetical protein
MRTFCHFTGIGLASSVSDGCPMGVASQQCGGARIMKFARSIVMAVVIGAMWTGTASAALIVSGSVGGAPTGVVLDNLDWLPLGTGGGLSPISGVTISFFGNAAAVQGTNVGYAAPFLSGGNGAGFGNPIGVTDQPNGANTTHYVSAGATRDSAAAAVELLMPAPQRYFGLLWGSVDNWNTLFFYDGATLIGSVTGANVVASPNGDQGVQGTLYVNIVSTVAFDRILATSVRPTFEFDNIAFSDTPPVPEPAALALLGVFFFGAGAAVRRRRQ